MVQLIVDITVLKLPKPMKGHIYCYIVNNRANNIQLTIHNVTKAITKKESENMVLFESSKSNVDLKK